MKLEVLESFVATRSNEIRGSIEIRDNSVKCLIHHVVRNFKRVFLKGVLLNSLTSRKHFYFGEY